MYTLNKDEESKHQGEIIQNTVKKTDFIINIDTPKGANIWTQTQSCVGHGKIGKQ